MQPVKTAIKSISACNNYFEYTASWINKYIARMKRSLSELKANYDVVNAIIIKLDVQFICMRY